MKEFKTKKKEYKKDRLGFQIDELDTKLNELAEQKQNVYREAMLKVISHMDDNLATLLTQLEENNQDDEIRLKWKYVGLVMDRLFLGLSLIYFVITFSSIILATPDFYNTK